MNNQSVQSTYLQVSGMHCASCAVLVERKLKKIPEVASASVSFANHQAVVSLKRPVAENVLLQAVSDAGYSASLQDSNSDDRAQKERSAELSFLKSRLIVGAFLTVLLMISMLPQAPAFLMQPWLLWLLATPVQFWVGWRFYQGAWAALRAGGATMDTLIALGTSVAYGYSVVAVVFDQAFRSAGIEPHLYFEAAAAIITFVMLGKFLEIRSRGKTAAALESLLSLHPKIATRMKEGGKTESVAIQDVAVGDILLVKAGEQVPVDGEILDSSAVIDESMVTGESIPVQKNPGDVVIGATVNTAGSFQMRAKKVGSDMFLSQIIEAVRHAQASKPQVQQLVDTISGVFVPVVLGLAALTFIVWWIFGPEPGWLYGLVSMTAVLIIACPCALGLATPMALISGIGRGAKAGILIKDASVLESAERITAIVFDKTGTITQGKPSVRSVAFDPNISQSRQKALLKMIGSLEVQSQHPLATAVVGYVEQRLGDFSPQKVSDVSEVAGSGVVGTIGGSKILAGTDYFLRTSSAQLADSLVAETEVLREQGQTVIQVAVDGVHVAAIGLTDQIREGARSVMRELQQAQLRLMVLSGDTEKTVAAVAQQVGISEIEAGVLPDRKDAVVSGLIDQGEVVAFVGDGINDAPALARSNLGIAMGSGTDVARGAAEIVLLRSDIRLVPQALRLATATLGIIRQNLFWAFAYNVILIPVAMGALYPAFGIQLQPAFAGAAMALSSVTVVLNAARLQTLTLVRKKA